MLPAPMLNAGKCTLANGGARQGRAASARKSRDYKAAAESGDADSADNWSTQTLDDEETESEDDFVPAKGKKVAMTPLLASQPYMPQCHVKKRWPALLTKLQSATQCRFVCFVVNRASRTKRTAKPQLLIRALLRRLMQHVKRGQRRVQAAY
jgi:hypothetical protein